MAQTIEVHIYVHKLVNTDLYTDIEGPQSDSLANNIKTFYKSVDIDIQLYTKTSKPKLSSVSFKDLLIKAENDINQTINNKKTTTVHLYISDTPPTCDKTLNGMLLHPKRLAAAVFVKGPSFVTIRNNSDLTINQKNKLLHELMLDVCIHEIGHMFNLTHINPNQGYDSAMMVTGFRDVKKKNDSWDFAKIILGNDYYNRNNRHCFPLSKISHIKIHKQRDYMEITPGVNEYSQKSCTPIWDHFKI